MAAAAAKKRRKFLTLADIQKVEDRPLTEVEIEEWGGWFRIRPLTSRQWEAIQNDARIEGAFDADGAPLIDELIAKPRALHAALCDLNGQPTFTLEEAEKLMDKSMLAVNRVCAEIVGATLSSLVKEKEAEAEETKAAEATFLAGESEPGEPE